MGAERKQPCLLRFRVWGPLSVTALVLLGWLGSAWQPASRKPVAEAEPAPVESPKPTDKESGGQSETPPAASPPQPKGAKFEVYWPPRDPQEARRASAQPLLLAALEVEVLGQPEEAAQFQLAVTLWRPSAEPDRERWNRTLAFADIAWMDYVRVWDDDGLWLWPNLPSLLRLPGRERVDRYGGMDPGKHVDNDFAAVLIRKYSVTGSVELPGTRDAPLVSAEWYSREVPSDRDRHRIAHLARSDDFLIHPTSDLGRVKVWLIYADFLGAEPPGTWPEKREWAGGILAYWEVDVAATSAGGYEATARPERPREDTGFDWQRWAVRPLGTYETVAKARLSDRSTPSARP